MEAKRSIYLDNAATSWPKPESVVDAICRYYKDVGVAAHRGVSSKASDVARALEQCRTEIARFVNAETDLTIFCFNGTDGLNIAINGLVASGQNVVTSAIEHNSILRPLFAKQKSGGIKLDIVGCANGLIDLDELADTVGPETSLCCVSHVSNVTGVVQPIRQISELCKKNDTLLLVDACQSIAHIDVDFSELGADILVSSGHKGLMGPLGTGFLCLSQKAAELIRPTRLGGTGTMSESIDPPINFPSCMEAGNLNVGGIMGLLAGLEFVKNQSLDSIAQHELRLIDLFRSRFANHDQIEIYGNLNSTGVLSFNLLDHEPQTVAALLDSAFGIQLRAGLHCAPLIHKPLGSDKFGGTLRISPGVFNTEEDIILLCDALEQIIG